ncbi:MAG TPA: methyltransferase domain-containing protein [Gemmatimonadaceae bacterium]|jgi:ubiquinone/menaquinone biosynthesis C-methylase UbiE|nr:methyltransferase domain-containing protein [Gemmatimonadaceae bacterium]
MSEGRAYHEGELEIARSPGDPRRILPTVPPTARRVLDVGCGAGQSLIGLALPPDVAAIGVDRDADALTLGTTWTNDVCFVCGSGASLPFADQSFDFVFSRVALPYMHVPTALKEIRRVLSTDGRMWLVLHGPGIVFSQLASAVRGGHAKSALFQSYAAVNGALYHLTGRLLRWPIGGRYESFQTRRIIPRLRETGFTDIQVESAPHFIVQARKA